jgi:hypothetical protein
MKETKTSNHKLYRKEMKKKNHNEHHLVQKH